MTSFIYMLPLGGGGSAQGLGRPTRASVLLGHPKRAVRQAGQCLLPVTIRRFAVRQPLPASDSTGPRAGPRGCRRGRIPDSTTGRRHGWRCARCAALKRAVDAFAARSGPEEYLIELNGNPVAGARCEPSEEGARRLLRSGPRAWADGDVVTAYYPMSLRFEAIDDPRPEWKGVGSVLLARSCSRPSV